jgi:hypothetical protein
MLDDLVRVDWAGLTHAYGPADDLPGLLRGLAQGDDDALYELYGNIWHQGTVYPATAYAVPYLIRLLDGPDSDTAGILGLLDEIARARAGREDAAAHLAVAAGLPSYLRLLAAHPEQGVRAAVAATIGALGQAVAGGASAALRQAATGDSDPTVRAAAVLALGVRGDGVAEHLDDPAPLPRLTAALAMARTESALPAAAVSILERDAPACLGDIERLPEFDDDPLVWVLRGLRHRWELQVDLVTAWLRHPDPAVREGAAYAAEEPLMHWRPAAGRLAPALAAAVADPEKKVYHWAVRNLANAGRAATAYADQLAAAMDQHREPVAVTALARMGDPRADAYLAAVLAALPDADIDRLGGAFDALGPWADRCRAVITGAIPSAPAGRPREGLMRAAHRVGVPAAELLPVLRREADRHPRAVARVLGDLGPSAAEALPELQAMRRAGAGWDAELAIWRITGATGELLARVRAAISDRVEPEALEVLAAVGPAAGDLAGLLPRKFDSDDARQALWAAVAYWKLTADPVPVVPVLLRFLNCGPRGMVAVQCLGDIGPAAEAAAPVLRAAVESPYRQWQLSVGEDGVRQDEAWRDACSAALARIS